MEDKSINTSHDWEFFLNLQQYMKRLSISKKIIAGFALPILLMAVVSTVVYLSTKSLVDTARLVQHTEEVIGKGHLLEKLILDMETGERGFLITGKDAFLEPFINAEQQWDVEISIIKELVKDNPQQVDKLERIDASAKQWILLAAPISLCETLSLN